jgi:hypothetical protein
MDGRVDAHAFLHYTCDHGRHGDDHLVYEQDVSCERIHLEAALTS